MTFDEIQFLIDTDMAAVNALILDSLRSKVDLVEAIGGHIVNGGGKRVRPVLALLAASACGYEGGHHITLAAIVEFIHTATLLHDDVVDMSTQRRGRDTANMVWDNAASVLTGDFIYSRAFELMVRLDDIAILAMLAKASNQMAEGEVAQLTHSHNVELTEAQYFEVIEGKTATLFAATAAIASRLAGKDEMREQALHTYGNALGCAFQIIDDVLDYTADAETLGKNLGDDLAEGKLTLPIIYALQRCEPSDAERLKSIIQQGDVEALGELCGLIESCGALDAARERAVVLGEGAKKSLSILPESKYRQALEGLIDLVVMRDR